MSYFSSHFSHRHAPVNYAPTTYYNQGGYVPQAGYAPQPLYPQTGYAPATYIQSPPMAAPSFVNAQGVSVPSPTYYDQMNASPILPPQYNEHALAPSPYPMIDQHPSRVGGLTNRWKAKLSQKYHMYSDIPPGYAQPGVGGDSYLGQSAAANNLPPSPQQPQPLPYSSSARFEDDLNAEYHSTAPQPLPDVRSSYANPPTVRTPGGFSSPQHPAPSFGAPRERPRSLPHPIRPLPNLPPQSTTPGPSRVGSATVSSTTSTTSTRSTTPSLIRSSSESSAPVPPPRPHHHHHHRTSSSGSNSSSGSSLSGNGTPPTRSVIAAIPTNMAHEERRQLAQNLLSEIDAYERMQNRVFLFRLLPPLRFRVTVVRNIEGRPTQTETMMTMSELRAQLQHALEHDSQMVDQLGMTYEQLVGLARVQHGVKDVSVFPTFIYTKDCHVPSDKSTCSVCLADFAEGDVLKTVPCMHLFHTECIDEWLKMSKVCPVCKTNVEDDTPIDDDDDCCKGKKQPVTTSS